MQHTGQGSPEKDTTMTTKKFSLTYAQKRAITCLADAAPGTRVYTDSANVCTRDGYTLRGQLDTFLKLDELGLLTRTIEKPGQGVPTPVYFTLSVEGRAEAERLRAHGFIDFERLEANEIATFVHDFARAVARDLPKDTGFEYDTKLGHTQSGGLAAHAWLWKRGEIRQFLVFTVEKGTGKVTITAKLPTRRAGYAFKLPDSLKEPSIAVAAQRPIADVVQEICTRLLPAYAEVWTRYLDYAAQIAARVQERSDFVTRLVDDGLVHADVDSAATDDLVDRAFTVRKASAANWNAEGVHTSYKKSEAVELSIENLTPDQAEKVIQLLRSL